MDLESLILEAQQAFEHAKDAVALENEKARFLGKAGSITQRLKTLGTLDIAQRKTEGEKINQAKQCIEQALRARRQTLENALLERRLAAEAIDVTLPGRGAGQGSLHPVMSAWERAERIWQSIGFETAEGPEIETDWYNFTALNSPENHPARSMQDTFYLDARDEHGNPLMLRTHTSSIQVRYARSHRPPLKVIAPGRVYRVDSDATHSPMFTQIEGLWIDEHISFADLKSIYTDFLRKFFEREDLQVRFRPSYFPFTEPSAEIDMLFETGKHAGQWLEISGAGQVHPTVLQNMGLDPEHYTGFAFGTGLERLAMLRYQVEDLRLFFEGDLRFLQAFQ